MIHVAEVKHDVLCLNAEKMMNDDYPNPSDWNAIKLPPPGEFFPAGTKLPRSTGFTIPGDYYIPKKKLELTPKEKVAMTDFLRRLAEEHKVD